VQRFHSGKKAENSRQRAEKRRATHENPRFRPARSLLQLQTMVGNQCVGRMLQVNEEPGRPDRRSRAGEEPAGGEMMPRAVNGRQTQNPSAAEDRTVQEVRDGLGPGRSLDSPVRSRMEAAFGRPFARVRVHQDSKASKLADTLNARAFTVGQDIGFAAGQYRPGTLMGDAIIAHELAHTVQQFGTLAPFVPAGNRMTRGRDLEQDADRSAWRTVASLWRRGGEGLVNKVRGVGPRLKSGLALQRCIRDPEQDRQLARESARCPSPPSPATMVAPPGQYTDQGVSLPYDRIVPEPDPTRGVDNPEVMRTYTEPRRLEQLYYDAATGNHRAAWLVCQAEPGARSIGRQAAAHLHSLACLTVMSCRVQFDRLPFSTSTASGQRVRRIIADAFVAEAQRLRIRNEIIGHALTLLVGLSVARAAIAGTAVVPEAAAGRTLTAETAAAQEAAAVRGGARAAAPGEAAAVSQEVRAAAAGETRAAAEAGTAAAGGARAAAGGPRVNVLVVGAETAEEFAYAARAASRGSSVTVVNPQATAAARTYQQAGGNFVQGRIESLPRSPTFNIIREDFPFPLGRVYSPTAEFVSERLARLAPGGRWVIVTESEEFAATIRAAAESQGATVTTRGFAAAHEAAPSSVYPRETSRSAVIVERAP